MKLLIYRWFTMCPPVQGCHFLLTSITSILPRGPRLLPFSFQAPLPHPPFFLVSLSSLLILHLLHLSRISPWCPTVRSHWWATSQLLIPQCYFWCGPAGALSCADLSQGPSHVTLIWRPLERGPGKYWHLLSSKVADIFLCAAWMCVCVCDWCIFMLSLLSCF